MCDIAGDEFPFPADFFMPIEIIQVTAAYSNAMLVAIMPHISDFARELNLPTPTPVVQSQVDRFNCFPRSDHVGGRLILTNGCEFIFDHGHVENFVSSHSYFYLQNPDLIPRFYGPVRITEAQALLLAHGAIKKLGYTDEMLSADRPPEITRPERDGTNYIARYRLRWRDTTRGGNPNNPPTSAEFEVDATTGQILMVNILNPNTYRPDPKLNIHPPVVGAGPNEILVGAGRRIHPVSQAYANAFLAAILPECSHWAETIGGSIQLPITIKDVDKISYECGLVDDDPMASFKLKTGARFDYRHGQVIAFYAPDVMTMPGRQHPMTYPDIDHDRAKFFGTVNMTTNDAVLLVRHTIAKLGYSEQDLHIDTLPHISGPGWWGTNRIARCFIEWRNNVTGATWVNAEVDIGKKVLKSLYVNDHANTSIWRNPPTIGVPLSVLPAQIEPSSASSTPPSSGEQKPPVNLPPNMLLPAH